MEARLESNGRIKCPAAGLLWRLSSLLGSGDGRLAPFGCISHHSYTYSFLLASFHDTHIISTQHTSLCRPLGAFCISTHHFHQLRLRKPKGFAQQAHVCNTNFADTLCRPPQLQGASPQLQGAPPHIPSRKFVYRAQRFPFPWLLAPCTRRAARLSTAPCKPLHSSLPGHARTWQAAHATRRR